MDRPSYQQQVELQRQSLAGDKLAREKLINSILPLAIREALKLRIDFFEREDYRQEAALVVSRCIDWWDPIKGRLTTFIASCVKNRMAHVVGESQFIATNRKGQEILRVGGGMKAAEAMGRSQPVADVETQELAGVVQDALDGMRDTDRQVFIRQMAGETDAQIAKALGLASGGVVKSIRCKALKALRNNPKLANLATAYGWDAGSDTESTDKLLAPVGREANRAA
jgi:RNA polymerase sigma factor (sigma-70 family)